MSGWPQMVAVPEPLLAVEPPQSSYIAVGTTTFPNSDRASHALARYQVKPAIHLPFNDETTKQMNEPMNETPSGTTPGGRRGLPAPPAVG